MGEEFDWFGLQTVGHTDLDKLQKDNVTNVVLKDKEYYKGRDWVKEDYTDSEGNFDESGFNQAYSDAVESYNVYDDMNRMPDQYYSFVDSKANRDSGIAVVKDSFKISKIAQDPFGRSFGLVGKDEYGEQTISIDELAQQNFVMDSATGKFRDYTAENTFLNFTEPLVMDQYDADEVVDGVKHVKGEYKKDKKGMFYYRTAREGEDTANKQVLTKFNIFTNEKSIWNYIDPFDADNVHNGAGKVITRTAIELLWKLHPYTKAVSSAISVALASADALAEMYKSGKALNDSTDGIDTANDIQTWIRMFNPGRSEESKRSFFTFDNLGRLISDSAGQLMQQKMVAKIPSMIGIASPTVAKVLSRTYMAATSASEMAHATKALGLSPKESALMHIGTMAGMYGIFSTDLGSVALKSLGLDDLANGVRQSISTATKGIAINFEKNLATTGIKRQAGLVAKGLQIGRNAQSLLNGITKQGKNFKSLINSNTVIGSATGEGAEEISEMWLQEGIKLFYNNLSEAGYTTTKNKKFKFEDLGEKTLLTGLGGALGGAVFKLTEMHLGDFNSSFSGLGIVELVAKGKATELINDVNLQYEKGTLEGSDKLSFEVEEGTNAFKPAEKDKSQMAFVRDQLLNTIKAVDSIFKQHGYNSDYDKIRKDYGIDLQNVIDMRFDTTLGADIKQLTGDLVLQQIEINKVLDDGGDASELQTKIKETAKKLKAIQDGNEKAHYLEQGLFVSNQELSNLFGIPTRDALAKARYGKKYSDLDTVNQKESINTEIGEYYKDKKPLIDSAYSKYKEVKDSIDIKKIVESGKQITPYTFKVGDKNIAITYKELEELRNAPFKVQELVTEASDAINKYDKTQLLTNIASVIDDLLINKQNGDSDAEEKLEQLVLEYSKEYKEASEGAESIDDLPEIGEFFIGESQWLAEGGEKGEDPLNTLYREIFSKLALENNDSIFNGIYTKEYSQLLDNYNEQNNKPEFDHLLHRELEGIKIGSRNLIEYLQLHRAKLNANKDEYTIYAVDPNGAANIDDAIAKVTMYIGALQGFIQVDPFVDAFLEKDNTLNASELITPMRELNFILAELESYKSISENNLADPLKIINNKAIKHVQQRAVTLASIIVSTASNRVWKNYSENLEEFGDDLQKNIVLLDKLERAFRLDVEIEGELDIIAVLKPDKLGSLKDTKVDTSISIYSNSNQVNYINTILNVDPKYYSKYKAIIEGEDSIAPLYVQEIVIRQLESFINSDNTFFNGITEGLLEDRERLLDNVIIVQGAPGVGKTSAILNTLLNILNKKIAIFTPQESQLENIDIEHKNIVKLPGNTNTSLIGLFGGTKRELDEGLNSDKFTVTTKKGNIRLNPTEIHKLINAATFNTDILNQLDVIVIDESSNLSAIELEFLNESLKMYNKDRTTKLKLVLLGDKNQLGARYTKDGQSIKFGLSYFVAQSTIPLDVSLRSQYNLLNNTLDQFDNKLKELNSDIENTKTSEAVTIGTSYFVNTEEFIGYKINGNVSDFKDLKGTKVYVTNNVIDAKKNVELKDFEILTPAQVQGKEYDYVIIKDIGAEFINTKGATNSSMLSTLEYLTTMFSRAKKGAILLNSESGTMVTLSDSVEVEEKDVIKASKFGNEAESKVIIAEIKKVTLKTLDSLIDNESEVIEGPNTVEIIDLDIKTKLLLLAQNSESYKDLTEQEIEVLIDKAIKGFNAILKDIKDYNEKNKIKSIISLISNTKKKHIFSLLKDGFYINLPSKRVLIKPKIKIKVDLDQEADNNQFSYNPSELAITLHEAEYNRKVEPKLGNLNLSQTIIYTFHRGEKDIEYLKNKYNITNAEAISMLTVIKSYAYTQNKVGYIKGADDLIGEEIKIFVKKGEKGDVSVNLVNGELEVDKLSQEGSLRVIARIGDKDFSIAVLPSENSYKSYIKKLKTTPNKKLSNSEQVELFNYHNSELDFILQLEKDLDGNKAIELDRTKVFNNTYSIAFKTFNDSSKTKSLKELKENSPGMFFSPVMIIFGRPVVFASTDPDKANPESYTESLNKVSKDVQFIPLDLQGNIMQEVINVYKKIRDANKKDNLGFVKALSSLMSPYSQNALIEVLLELDKDPNVNLDLLFKGGNNGKTNLLPIEYKTLAITDAFDTQVIQGGKNKLKLFKVPLSTILGRLSQFKQSELNAILGKMALTSSYKEYFPNGIYYNKVVVDFKTGTSDPSDYALKTKAMFGSEEDILISNIETVSLPAYGGSIKNGMKTNIEIEFNDSIKPKVTKINKDLILKQHTIGEDVNGMEVTQRKKTYIVNINENGLITISEKILTPEEPTNILTELEEILKDVEESDREFLIMMKTDFDPTKAALQFKMIKKYARENKLDVKAYREYTKYC